MHDCFRVERAMKRRPYDQITDALLFPVLSLRHILPRVATGARGVDHERALQQSFASLAGHLLYANRICVIFVAAIVVNLILLLLIGA